MLLAARNRAVSIDLPGPLLLAEASRLRRCLVLWQIQVGGGALTGVTCTASAIT